LKPQYLLPGLVVVAMLALVFGIQPGGSSTPADAYEEPAALPTVEPTATPAAFPTATPGNAPAIDGGVESATSEVAGARSTPEATPTEDPYITSAPSECGDVREASYAMSVEQTLAGAAVQATQTSIYPIDYLRCILLATGGQQATSLAAALGKANREALHDEDLIGLAEVLHRAKDLERAQRAAEAAVARALDPEALRVRAQIAKARGDRAAALLDFEALARDVDDPAVRLELAKLYEHHVKAPDKALELLERGTGERAEDAERRRVRLERKARKQAKAGG